MGSMVNSLQSYVNGMFMYMVMMMVVIMVLASTGRLGASLDTQTLKKNSSAAHPNSFEWNF